MNKFYYFFFLVIIFFAEADVEGQKVFRDGYIVKHTGESLDGLVEYSIKQDNPAVCTFKRFDIARKIVYLPGEIEAFGYFNGNRYESKQTDNRISFYEVIVTGEIILYRQRSKFYVDKKHTGLIELKNGPISIPVDGSGKQFSNLEDFLTFITEGKAGTISNKFNLKNDITDLITIYDKKSGQPYYVFNRNVSENQISQLTLNAGAGKNKIGMESGINIYILNLKPTLKNQVPKPKPEIANITGLTIEKQISRLNDRLSIKLGVLYFKQAFYSYNEVLSTSGATIRNDMFFNFTAVKVPVLLQYSITGNKIVPFFNAGAAYQFNKNQKFLRIEETENELNEVRTRDYNDMYFKPAEFSVMGGVGLRKKVFNTITINLQGRVEVGSGMFVKFVDNVQYYKQNSIQATFLIGITF